MTLDRIRPESENSDAVAHIADNADDVANADATYLAKFGYKQELNRALGLFSSFGVQFTVHLGGLGAVHHASSSGSGSSDPPRSGRSSSAAHCRSSAWD